MKEMQTHIRQLQAGTLSRRGPGAEAIDGAQVRTPMSAKAGVNFKAARVTADEFRDEMPRVKPFIMSQWNIRPNAPLQLAIAFKGGASCNDTMWQHGRVDQRIPESKGEKDEARRRKMYCEMQQIAHDDGGQASPSFINIPSGAASRVKNPVTNPVSALEWIAESCWLEA